MKIKNLFKGIPDWQSPDPQKRIRALSDMEDQQILGELLQNDPDIEVRAAAIASLDSIDILSKFFSKTDASSDLIEAIVGRVTQLLGKGTKADLLSQVIDQRMLPLVARTTVEPELAKLLLALLPDDSVQIEIACHGQTAEIRQMAADSIDDIETVKQLNSLIKGRDKAIYTSTKNRIRDQAAEQASRVQIVSRARQLVEKLDHLSRAVDDPMFERSYAHLVRSWDGLLTPIRHHAEFQVEIETLTTGFQTAVSRCDSLIVEKNRRQAEQRRLEKESRIIVDDLSKLVGQLVDLPSSIESAVSSRDAISKRWVALPVEAISQTIKDTYTSTLKRINDVLETNLDWQHIQSQVTNLAKAPTGDIKSWLTQVESFRWPENSKIADDYESCLQELRQQLANRQKKDQKNKEQTDNFIALIKELEMLVAEGRTKSGQRLRRQLKDLIAQTPSLDGIQVDQFNRLSKQLDELSAWQKICYPSQTFGTLWKDGEAG